MHLVKQSPLPDFLADFGKKILFPCGWKHWSTQWPWFMVLQSTKYRGMWWLQLSKKKNHMLSVQTTSFHNIYNCLLCLVSLRGIYSGWKEFLCPQQCLQVQWLWTMAGSSGGQSGAPLQGPAAFICIVTSAYFTVFGTARADVNCRYTGNYRGLGFWYVYLFL